MPTLTPEQEDELLQQALNRLRGNFNTPTVTELDDRKQAVTRQKTAAEIERGIQDNYTANDIGNAIETFNARSRALGPGETVEKLRSQILNPVLQQIGLPAPVSTAPKPSWDTITRADGSLVRANNETGQILPFNDFMQPPAPVSAPAQSPGFVYMGEKAGEGAARTAYDASEKGKKLKAAQLEALLPKELGKLSGPVQAPRAPRAPRLIRIGENSEGFEPGTYEQSETGLKRIAPLPPENKSVARPAYVEDRMVRQRQMQALEDKYPWLLDGELPKPGRTPVWLGGTADDVENEANKKILEGYNRLKKQVGGPLTEDPDTGVMTPAQATSSWQHGKYTVTK
ncbi:MAG: hypothetical protein ACOYD4_03900 [Solirubrobacterales bacterium]